MEDAEKRPLIKDEYLQLQKVIEDFDARTITIKAWSVSFSLATLAAAFAASTPGALLVSSGSAFLFWLTEAYWKEFQATYYRRVEDIEKFFAGEAADIVPMQIKKSWEDAWNRDAKWPKLPRWIQPVFWRRGMVRAMLPHLVVVLAGVILFVLVKVHVQWITNLM